MKCLSCLVECACLIFICSRACFIPLLPHIHPPAIGHHSCCVLVPPSGISHLPPAFSLSPHLLPSFLQSPSASSLSRSLCGCTSLWIRVTLRDLLSPQVLQNNKSARLNSGPSFWVIVWNQIFPEGRQHDREQNRKSKPTPCPKCVIMSSCVSPGSPYQSRTSITSRASGLAPSHRIKDRDYVGWMDFGRRSAEEYEYSS